MKTIGLLGGISWHSTLEYYRLINEYTNKRLGGYHSAKMLIYSFNFAEIRELHTNSEVELCKRLITEAQNLEKSGAECLLIGANTLHIFFSEIQAQLNIPVIHIADAVGNSIVEKEIKKVGLLGTATTMEKSFYSERIKLNDIITIIPNEAERKVIDDIIFKELVHGMVTVESKNKFLEIIDFLINEEGIEGIVLGCTEIPLLINEKDVPIPVFNSTEIHAKKAVEFAIEE